MTTRFERCSRIALLAATFAFLAPAAHADTVALDAVARGFYSPYSVDGPHNGRSAANNYVTGNSGGSRGIMRDWFQFDLSGIQGPIEKAELRLYTARYLSEFDTSETMSLYSVETDPGKLGTSQVSAVEAFNDLGSGTLFGTATFSATNAYSYVSIVLNQAAIDALRSASGGVFALGGAVTSLSTPRFNEALFWGSNGGRTQLIVGVPEPATLLLLGMGMALSGLGLRRRQRS